MKALEQAEDTLVSLAQPLVDGGCKGVECCVLVEKTYEVSVHVCARASEGE